MEKFNQSKKKILILGVGNLILGDEGVGIHAIKYLETLNLTGSIELLDGGTGGFHILSVMEDYKTLIMIDATIDSKEEGTLSLIEPKFASDFPRALSSHDIGLRDLVETATVLGHMPKIYLITVSVKNVSEVRMTLSENIQKSLPEVGKLVSSILEKII